MQGPAKLRNPDDRFRCQAFPIDSIRSAIVQQVSPSARNPFAEHFACHPLNVLHPCGGKGRHNPINASSWPPDECSTLKDTCTSTRKGQVEEQTQACPAHLAVLLLGEVGSAQEGIDGGAGHPGKRGRCVDGDVAPRLAQAAVPPPPLLLSPPLRLLLQRTARQVSNSTDAISSDLLWPQSAAQCSHSMSACCWTYHSKEHPAI